jgi:PAS domain S-box-containing protein
MVLSETKGPIAQFSDSDLLNQVHDAINATDAHGILCAWNAESERLYGYKAEEALGQHVSILFFPVDIPILEHEIIGPLLVNRTRHELTVRNRRKDGAEIYVALRLAVVRDATGLVTRIIGCSNDITERKWAEDALKCEIAQRKRMEAALRSNEQRLKHLVSRSPGVLYSCDATRGFAPTFVSDNVHSILGYPPESFLGNPEFWRSRIHRDDCASVIAKSAELNKPGPVLFEYRFLHADGNYRHVRDSVVSIHDESGNLTEIVGQWIDVTLEKEAEDARREHEKLRYYAEALLATQEAERKRISRELHDDLNQRLATLILEISMLERAVPARDRDLKQRLTGIKDQTASVSDDVRRIALQLHSAGLEQFGLCTVLESECRTMAERTGIDIEFETNSLHDPLPEHASLCLYRVAQECLRNVAKHSRAQRAVVRVSGAPGEVRLQVEDWGIGFNPEETKARVSLGLISMKERLRQVNGALFVDSTPGSGTRVEARVPLGSHFDGRTEQWPADARVDP